MRVLKTVLALDLSKQQYEAFRSFLEESCGIVLGAGREYLVKSRLNGLVASQGLSMDELRDRLRDGDRALKCRVIDLMTTNETSWFRNDAPFSVFSEHVLTDLHARSLRAPVIWSAACSYGQEPYSLSMLVDDFQRRCPGGLPGLRIVATDISPSVLEHAAAACYDEASVRREVPDSLRLRYFERHGEGLRVVSRIRGRVRFQEFNLLQDFAGLGRFDVIFCRNVLIYFSAKVRQDILERMARALNPGGYLFLGGAETLGPAGAHFDTVRVGRNLIYRRIGPGACPI